MKPILTCAVLVAGALSLGADKGGWAHRTYEVTFTNITHGVVLTPPIFALSPRQIDVFEVGEPASLALEKLAEGGITDDLRAEWEQIGLHDVVQTMDPVPPGQSITVELTGNHFSRLNLASMLLPTNDGYVAMNGPRAFQRLGKTTTYLMAYDAGTEVNDELCTSIPGPHCGGEGFNADGGEGFVVHHPGIHGEGDLSRQSYNWGEPVAKVTVRVSR